MAKRRRNSPPSVVPVSFPAMWDWSTWGEKADRFIGYAHFDQHIRQYWEIGFACATGVALFRDGKQVDLYTVGWDSAWDSKTNRACFLLWTSRGVEPLWSFWDPNNGRMERFGLLWEPNGTISLFLNGEFQAELWRDIPAGEIYPVFFPRFPGSSSGSGVRLQDVPTLENACFKKVMDLDPSSIALLPKLLHEEADKRKRNDFRDLYYTPVAGHTDIGYL